MEEMERRLSPINLEEILGSSKVKKHYDGFETKTLTKAIISVENSSVNPEAVSPAGAVGLMQIMPQTAAMTAYELKDPRKNILVGMSHFDSLYNKHSGRYGKDALRFALAEYLVGSRNLNKVIRNNNVQSWRDLENATEFNMRNLSDSNGTTVVDYAEKIISNYFKLKSMRTKPVRR